MQWKMLTTAADLDEANGLSFRKPVLIFKHSTRCSISKATLAHLERSWTPEDDRIRSVYLLDLLAHRAISNAIAERYGVAHESPQVLVISQGNCVYHASHFAIHYQEVIRALDAAFTSA